jgi:hypothetical protein
MRAAPRRILALATSAASVVALAPGAQAATLSTSPCVRTVEGVGTVPLAGTGFTPGTSVSIRSSPPGVFTSAVTDAAGNFATTSTAPSFNPFSRSLQTFSLTATDTANPLLAATTTYKQVRVGYTTNPSSGRPTSKATHTVRGFVPGKSTYLHFRYGGQTKRNVKLGRADSPCGVASKRMALLPTRSRPGIWTVYADQAQTYSKSTRPQLKYSFRITRTFG